MHVPSPSKKSSMCNGHPCASHPCGTVTLVVPYVTQQCLRAGNRATGPDFSGILIGKASKSALRPAEDASPLESGRNRPGSLISGPEELLLRNIGYMDGCGTWMTVVHWPVEVSSGKTGSLVIRQEVGDPTWYPMLRNAASGP